MTEGLTIYHEHLGVADIVAQPRLHLRYAPLWLRRRSAGVETAKARVEAMPAAGHPLLAEIARAVTRRAARIRRQASSPTRSAPGGPNRN